MQPHPPWLKKPASAAYIKSINRKSFNFKTAYIKINPSNVKILSLYHKNKILSTSFYIKI